MTFKAIPGGSIADRSLWPLSELNGARRVSTRRSVRVLYVCAAIVRGDVGSVVRVVYEIWAVVNAEKATAGTPSIAA